jgi:hypothetical protein
MGGKRSSLGPVTGERSSDQRERDAEFAVCEALDRLLDERGALPHLDDTHWWMKGVEDAADIAARQGCPWKAAG